MSRVGDDARANSRPPVASTAGVRLRRHAGRSAPAEKCSGLASRRSHLSRRAPTGTGPERDGLCPERSTSGRRPPAVPVKSCRRPEPPRSRDPLAPRPRRAASSSHRRRAARADRELAEPALETCHRAGLGGLAHQRGREHVARQRLRPTAFRGRGEHHHRDTDPGEHLAWVFKKRALSIDPGRSVSARSPSTRDALPMATGRRGEAETCAQPAPCSPTCRLHAQRPHFHFFDRLRDRRDH